jgi:UrcA family protein
MLISRTKLALALAVVVAGSVAAVAGDISLGVKTSDLDLTTEAGQAALTERVGHAADQVCGGRPQYHNLQDWNGFLGCRSKALAAALPQMQSVIAMAQHKGGFELGMNSETPHQ